MAMNHVKLEASFEVREHKTNVQQGSPPPGNYLPFTETTCVTWGIVKLVVLPNNLGASRHSKWLDVGIIYQSTCGVAWRC